MTRAVEGEQEVSRLGALPARHGDPDQTHGLLLAAAARPRDARGGDAEVGAEARAYGLGHGTGDAQAAVGGPATEIAGEIEQVVIRAGKLGEIDLVPVGMQVPDDGQAKRIAVGA